MLAVAWFIIMDWSKSSPADSASCCHRLHSCPVLPAQVSVFIPWIAHLPDLLQQKRTLQPCTSSTAKGSFTVFSVYTLTHLTYLIYFNFIQSYLIFSILFNSIQNCPDHSRFPRLRTAACTCSNDASALLYLVHMVLTDFSNCTAISFGLFRLIYHW